MSSSSPFPPVRRIVTTHATLVSDQTLPLTPYPGAALNLRQLWSSTTHPDDPNSSPGLDKGLLDTGFRPLGSSLKVVDIPPASQGFMHRSLTLDYTIVLKGRVCLRLDDGSRTVVSEGDVVVLRAGMHQWDNEMDGWARLVRVMLPSLPPVSGGRELPEELGL